MGGKLASNPLGLCATGRLTGKKVVGGRLGDAGVPGALAATAGALAQSLLFLLKAMQEVDDDVADTGEEAVETLLTGFLAERFLEDGAQEVGYRAKVLRVDADAVEGATCNVELVAQAHVDVRDLALAGRVPGPLRQGFEELLGSDEQVRHALFNGRQLLWLRRLSGR